MQWVHSDPQDKLLIFINFYLKDNKSFFKWRSANGRVIHEKEKKKKIFWPKSLDPWEWPASNFSWYNITPESHIVTYGHEHKGNGYQLKKLFTLTKQILIFSTIGNV